MQAFPNAVFYNRNVSSNGILIMVHVQYMKLIPLLETFGRDSDLNSAQKNSVLLCGNSVLLCG